MNWRYSASARSGGLSRVVRKSRMDRSFSSILTALADRGRDSRVSSSGRGGLEEKDLEEGKEDRGTCSEPMTSDSGGAGSSGGGGEGTSRKNPALGSIHSSSSSGSSGEGSSGAWGLRERPSAPVCLLAGTWTSSKSNRRIAEIQRLMSGHSTQQLPAYSGVLSMRS